MVSDYEVNCFYKVFDIYRFQIKVILLMLYYIESCVVGFICCGDNSQAVVYCFVDGKILGFFFVWVN